MTEQIRGDEMGMGKKGSGQCGGWPDKMMGEEEMKEEEVDEMGDPVAYSQSTCK